MKKLSNLSILFVALLFSCSNNPVPHSGSDEMITAENVAAVCVYDYSANGLQVLADVKDPKSHVTFVKLGETVNYPGEVITDSASKKEYCKIELSDGTTGWTRKDYIITGAQPAAIMKATAVYERPDILTKSAKKSYNEIDIVAVTEEKDEWVNVTGRNKLNSGWILKENISYNKEDVSMAILARKELFDEKGNIKEDKILEFVNNAPFPGSQVVKMLRERVIQNVEQEAEENAQEVDSLDSEDLPAWD